MPARRHGYINQLRVRGENIDEVGWSSERIHGIKDGLGAGPRDWAGIARNGDAITGDEAGNAVNNGPWTSYDESI